MNKCEHYWEVQWYLEFPFSDKHDAMQKRKCNLCKAVQRRFVVCNGVFMPNSNWRDSRKDVEDLDQEIVKRVEMLKELTSWMEEQMYKNKPIHIYNYAEQDWFEDDNQLDYDPCG